MNLLRRRDRTGRPTAPRAGTTGTGVGEATDEETRNEQQRRRPRGWWLPVVLFLVGAIILGYPVTSTLYNNWRQHQFSEQYNQAVAAADPSELKDVLAAAEKYNESIDGLPILDPWLQRVKQDDAYRKYLDYLDQLSTTDVMARVRVPSQKIDLPVYHGTEDSTLAKGVGHLYGTDLPVGGTNRHTVLTGHTGIPTATLFDHLIDMKVGDVFYIDTYGRTMAYKVTRVDVVLPEQTDLLKRVPGKDLATLITCTPYGVNDHRLLVTGERIPLDQAQKVAGSKDGWSLLGTLTIWMWAAGVGALLALLGALWNLWAALRRKKDDDEDNEASVGAGTEDKGPQHVGPAPEPAAEPTDPDGTRP